jgi:hypothetical protein
MSAIASFLRVRESDLQGLREAAIPVKRLFRAPRDGFWEYLRARAEPVLEFGGSGHIFGTLFSFLDEKRGIDFMKSRHADLATFLSTTRGSTCFFLTVDHRDRHRDALEPKSFDGADLRAYYNDFNETDEPAAEEAMFDGIKALRAALDAVHKDSVVFLNIG